MARSNAVLEYIQSQLVETRTAGLSDQELLGSFTAQRDESAFKALLRRHGPMVLRACQRVLDRPDDVEDVFQATFLALAQKPPGSVNRPGSVGSWLYGVAHHLAQQAHRKHRRQHAREARSPLPRSVADPLGEISGRELLAIVDEEMASLPEGSRASLLCHLEVDTGDEAARRLGCSLRTFRRRLREARELLHKQLQRRGITLPATTLAALLLEMHRASATVPAPLAANTLHAAVLLAAGKPLVDGLVSAHVLALAKGVTTAMSLSKLKVVLLALLLVAGLAAGVGGLAQQNLKEPPAAKRSPEAALPQRQLPQPEAEGTGRTDQFGDPLPEGALARIGTLRFRPEPWGGAADVAFVPKSQTLVSVHWRNAQPQKSTVYFWDLATGKEQRRLEGPEQCRSTSISPDGKRLVGGGINEAGGEVWSWDLTAEPPKPCWKQQLVDRVSFVELAPDGKTLACRAGTGNASKIYLLDAQTGEQRHILESDSPKALFSPNGKTLATLESAKRNTVCLWDVATGTKRHTLDCLWAAQAVAFTPDSRVVATACHGQGIGLWEAATGKKLRQIEDTSSSICWMIGFSTNSKTLLEVRKLLEGGKQQIRFWDPATAKQCRPAVEVEDLDLFRVDTCRLSHDGKYLVAADRGVFEVWETETGQILRTAGAPRGGIREIAFSPDGKTLATLSNLPTVWQGEVRLWETSTGKPGKPLQWEPLQLQLESLPLPLGRRSASTVSLLGYARDHRLDTCLRTWGQTSFVVASWNTQTGRLSNPPVTLPDTKAKCWALAPDGRLLAQGYSGHIVLHDLAADKPVGRLEGHAYPALLAFSADGQSLLSCTRSSHLGRNPPKKVVAVWDVATRRLRLPPQPLEGSTRAVALSPDGRWLAADMDEYDPRNGQWSYCIQLWETASGTAGPCLPADREVASLAFAPDSRVLAAGYADGAVRLWEMGTWQERRCFTGHRGGVGALAFSADGSRLVSGSADTTALVWDVSFVVPPLGGRGVPPEGGTTNELWAALSKPDAAAAYRAICLLEQTPKRTIPLLRHRLQPVVPGAKQVTRWLADLDAERFEVRRQAFAELEKHGSTVEPALRQALAGQPSVEARRQIEALLAQLDPQRSPSHLAAVRGVEVLERIGTPEARKVLEELAKRPPEYPVVREAQAALKRLALQPKH